MAKAIEDLKAAQAADHAGIEAVKTAVQSLGGRVTAQIAALQAKVADLSSQLSGQQNDAGVLEVTEAIRSDVAELQQTASDINAIFPDTSQGTPPPA